LHTSKAGCTHSAFGLSGADGVWRTHAREGIRTVETLVGTVEVSRAGHGARGRATLFPPDAELNLPSERFSCGIRRRAAEEASNGSFDEVVTVVQAHTAATVAKRQVEALVRRAADDFERFHFERRLQWHDETTAGSHLLVLSFRSEGRADAPRRSAPRHATGGHRAAAPTVDLADQGREAAYAPDGPGRCALGA
jgi:hypothetical protein